jgi:hypothetical protein
MIANGNKKTDNASRMAKMNYSGGERLWDAA